MSLVPNIKDPSRAEQLLKLEEDGVLELTAAQKKKLQKEVDSKASNEESRISDDAEDVDDDPAAE